jgi:hypothetical protein
VSIAPVTHDILINTLTGLPTEATMNDEDAIAKYVIIGLEGVILLYDLAHMLTVHVGYNTPMFDTKYNLFAVFKSIVDEFSSDEDEFDSFPEKGKHFFYKGEMQDVLYYDGGETVKV